MSTRTTAKRLSLVVLALVLAACTASPAVQPAPTLPAAPPTIQPVAPTAAPTAAPATAMPTAAPAPVDDAWTRIQKTGVIRVGSPLDNPPFNMYNADFQADGFDIALTDALAKELGLKAEYNDYAFDGLLGALQLDRIDAAVAAMAVTAARKAVVDFTNSYYRGEDIILAAIDSPIKAIAGAEDLVPHRIGVQRGTVYESYLLASMVEPGKLPAANLRAYAQPSDAVGALGKGQIELVIMDRVPGLALVSQGKAKDVGKSMYMQDYAIAVPKGSTLASHLNQALAVLLADGTVERLAEKYLRISSDQLIPVAAPTEAPASTLAAPTPVPTPQPLPTPGPIDDMAWVADLSYDDAGGAPVVQPGEAFGKGWRIRNSGTTTWPPEYQFVYAKGNTPASAMSGRPTAIGRTVAPGETIDIYVDLIAAQAPGIYQGFWQMKNTAGKGFGEQVWVRVQVPAPPPPPTATPSTTVAFWADKNQLAAGECTYLHWRVTNIKSVYLCAPSAACRGVAGEADEKVCPPSGTVTYQLNVEKQDRTVQPAYQSFQVAAPVNLASIVSFDADPLNILPGGAVNLWWRLQGSPGRIALLRNGALLADWIAGDTYRDQPPGSAQQVVYELQVWAASNDRGEPDKRQRAVLIGVNPAPPPPETRQLYRNACMTNQTLRAGDTLRVTLEGQGGTGYMWQEEPDYDGSVLMGSGQPEMGAGAAPGAPVTYTFSYLAGRGQTTLTLRYADPAGGVGTTDDVCAITVTVQ